MAKFAYDMWDKSRMSNIGDRNPIVAAEEYDSYLRKYPTDYVVYLYYANSLIIAGHDKEAEEAINYAESLVNSNYKLRIHKIAYNGYLKLILYYKIKLLIYREDYAKVYEILSENKHDKMLAKFDTKTIKQILTMCMIKLGFWKTDRKNDDSYMIRQIVDYKEEDFLAHMEKHTAGCAYTSTQKYKGIAYFSTKFPVDYIMQEIKKYIPSDKKMFVGLLEDRYTFKLDGCGRNNNKIVDYFDVKVLHNTTNFITMYPVDHSRDDIPYVDLNYLNEELYKDSSKVKRKSQIDKFNDRYGK